MENCLGRRCQVFQAWQNNEISEMEMERLCETCIITDNLPRNSNDYYD